MSTEIRPTLPRRSPSGSTPGYTSDVNRGQHMVGHGRWSAFALGLAIAAAGVGSSSSASAQQVDAAAQAKPTSRPQPAQDLEPVAEEAPEHKAGRGVVVIQRAGQPLGLGMVLGNDGRILTALSQLGSGNELEAKFADDSVSKLKLGHHDRAWDLALLVPQSGKWTEGLVASNGDPLREDATLRAFSSGLRGKPAASLVDLRSRRALIGGDDRLLDGALELGSRIAARDLGSPVIDEKGRVVGILGRACLPIEGKPCAPVAFGIPVQAVKSFLQDVPPDAVPPSAWLGIQGAAEQTHFVRGVRVLSVAKGSPAAEAKLHSGDRGDGDLIVGVGGKPVTTPEELATAIKRRAVGEKVQLTLFGKGLYRQADVVLRAPPDRAAAPPPRPAADQRALSAPSPEARPTGIQAQKRPKRDRAPGSPGVPPIAPGGSGDLFSDPL